MERTPTIHEKEIVINKNKLKSILDSKGMEYKELHKKIYDKYGLDLRYKGFMSLLDNRSTWKLLYAHAISDILNIDYLEIFEIVDIDVEKVRKYKEKWKQRYQKDDK